MNTMNALDALIGSMLFVLIVGMVAQWIRRKRAGARLSWKSIVAWASWGAQFLFWEALFAFDNDPETLTLSEMMVSSVPLWAMLGGTWFVCGALLLHWYDLDKRLDRLQASYLATLQAALDVLPARETRVAAVLVHGKAQLLLLGAGRS